MKLPYFALRRHATPAFLLLAAAVSLRVPIWAQGPQLYPDSPSYLGPALGLVDGVGYGAGGYGYRTPTYPLFLALIFKVFGRENFGAVVAVQGMLGLMLVLLLYAVGWMSTRNRAVALLYGLIYALDVGGAYWEISLLTECLTTFLLISALSLVLYLLLRPSGQRTLLLAAGALLAALALCRPVYLLYWVLPSVLVAGVVAQGLKPWLKRVSWVVLIPLVVLLGWSTRNWLVDGYFTPSTMTGIHLSDMVGSFMEQAPEEYGALRDVYLRHRELQMTQTGSHSATTWRALSDMSRETNGSWVQLSRELTAVSWQLIVRHPAAYFENVRAGFGWFWSHAIYHQRQIAPDALRRWAARLQTSRVTPLARDLFFLSLPALLLCLWLSRRFPDLAGPETTRAMLFVLLLIGTVWYSAVVSSLFEYGENARFRAPVAQTQYVAVVLVGWYLVRLALRLLAGLHLSRRLPRLT